MIIKVLKKYFVGIIVTIFTLFLLGYFITDFVYNNNNARYIYEFNTTSENVDYLITEEYFDEVFRKINDYNETADKKISYANIDYKEMLKTTNIYKEETFKISFLKKYFPSITRVSNGTVNLSEDRALKYFNLVLSYADDEIVFVNFKLEGYVNPFMIGAFSSLASLLMVIVLLIIFVNKDKMNFEIEDNKNIFSSIFHRGYWKGSLSFIKKVKDLCMVSILFALMLLCKLIPIPSGFGSLGIGLTYLVFATICMIYGPICGLFIGACSDILGFFMFQGGQVFFIGYVIDAMLAGFIYGICFYKKRITFTNCLISRVFVNMFINVVLGSLWWKIIYNLNTDAYLTYMLVTSIPKNILYLLPQSIFLYILFKAISKPLASFGLISNDIADNMSIF